MQETAPPFDVLDGYRLVRFLGRGGFGEVWLCQSEAMGDYRALKFITASNSDQLEKEYQALLHYRKAAAWLRSPHLVPIEHVNRNEAGLYYVMPLADGSGAAEPADPAWLPASLATLVHERANAAAWFPSREIIDLLLPVLDALQILSDAGLVHRDVKPENILFFNGQPCLADISLVGADAAVITRRGTPGYGTPSWYVGGHPDMFGVAATLFTLLTGNLPDRMGRAAFLWPPQGEASLSADERSEWKRLHAVIRRATEENVAERFVDFRTMAGALNHAQPHPAPDLKPVRTRERALTKPRRADLVLALILVVCVVGFWFAARSANDPGPEPVPATSAPTPAASSPTAAAQPPDTSPVSGARSKLRDAALLAHGALAAAQGNFYNPENPDDPPDEDYMSPDENDLYQDMLVNIQNYVGADADPDFPAALQQLDACLAAVPRIKKRPNVQLARRLLEQCADGRTSSPTAVGDPSFLVLGNDDLGYRVALLCRLGAEQQAEELLGNIVTGENNSDREKSEALVERARVRAMLGRFDEARTDAEQSVVVAGSKLALKTQRQNDIARLAKDIPAFAEHLKSHAGK